MDLQTAFDGGSMLFMGFGIPMFLIGWLVLYKLARASDRPKM